MAAKTPDEVWAAVKADIDATSAALGGTTVEDQSNRQQQLMRLAAITAWRLRGERCADDVEKVVAGG